MARFLELKRDLVRGVLRDYERLVTEANCNRGKELESVTKIQAQLRRYFAETTYHEKRRCAIVIERVYRGHVGRCVSNAKVLQKRQEQRMALFHCFATMIQNVFRGFHSRRYHHDFYARKEYIKTILEKSDMLRNQLAENRVRLAKEEQERRLRETKAEFVQVTEKLHHLVSTKCCPGVYNSPYTIDGVPTAFGIPVEDHLRTNTKTYLQNHGLRASRPARKRNRISLQAQSKYEAALEAEKMASKYSRTMRMSNRNFVAGGKGPFHSEKYIQGISNGTEYVEPWKITQSSRTGPSSTPGMVPFYTAVRKNSTFDEIADRIFDSAFEVDEERQPVGNMS